MVRCLSPPSSSGRFLNTRSAPVVGICSPLPEKQFLRKSTSGLRRRTCVAPLAAFEQATTMATITDLIPAPISSPQIMRPLMYGPLSPVMDLSEGLDAPILAGYLLVLVALLGGAVFLVVRQVLIRRELDETAKTLGDSIRGGKGTSEEYFELAAVLIRKKLYTQALKNLEKCITLWEGEEAELSQVFNALGFCYFSIGRNEDAIKEYKKAVKYQPGYVIAWNNLGDAYEKDEELKLAFDAYNQTLALAPDNTIAKQRADYLKTRITRLKL